MPFANRTPRFGAATAFVCAVALIAVALLGFNALADASSGLFNTTSPEPSTDVPRPPISSVPDDERPVSNDRPESSNPAGSAAPPLTVVVDEAVQLIDGRSWALGEGALRATNSGITWVPLDFNGERLGVANHQASKVFGVEGDSYTENRFAVMVEVPWSEVEPVRGEFDWTEIDQLVSDIETETLPGVGFFIWPQVYGPWIPSWAGAESGINFSADPHQVWEATLDDGQFLLTEEIGGFVDAVVERYGSNPQLVHVDMRQPIDEEFGEWVANGAPDSADPEIGRFARSYHQLWSEAFEHHGVDVSKLVSMVARLDYDGEAVLVEGYEAGFGQRDGVPERQQIWFSAYGNFIDEQSYLRFDPGWTGQSSDAIRYSEVTEYSFVDDRFGSTEFTLPRFRSALLWSVHAGRNWLAFPFGFLSDLEEFPGNQLDEEQLQELSEVHEMLEWAQLSVGHGAATSSDAWIWLRETNYTALNFNAYTEADRNDETVARNMGRWINQLEPDGHRTVPVNPTTTDQVHKLRAAGIDCDAGTCNDFLAHRTDAASGQNAVLFDLSEEFRGPEAGVATILVALEDNQSAILHLEYHTSTETVSTAEVRLEGHGGTKTAIFQVPDLAANDSVHGGDFRLVSSEGDVTIDLVRVVSDVVVVDREAS